MTVRIRVTKEQIERVDFFTEGYIEAAFWTEEENGTKGRTIFDLSAESLVKIVDDCTKFQTENEADLDNARTPDYNGHDFWLSRNGHGAGFFDRDLGPVGDRLQKAARAFGEVYVEQYRGVVYLR